MMQICPNCGEIAAYNSRFDGYYCGGCGWLKQIALTNADRIRVMSDEELAAELHKAFSDGMIYAMRSSDFGDYSGAMKESDYLERLKQPAEENAK